MLGHAPRVIFDRKPVAVPASARFSGLPQRGPVTEQRLFALCQHQNQQQSAGLQLRSFTGPCRSCRSRVFGLVSGDGLSLQAQGVIPD